MDSKNWTISLQKKFQQTQGMELTLRFLESGEDKKLFAFIHAGPSFVYDHSANSVLPPQFSKLKDYCETNQENNIQFPDITKLNDTSTRFAVTVTVFGKSEEVVLGVCRSDSDLIEAQKFQSKLAWERLDTLKGEIDALKDASVKQTLEQFNLAIKKLENKTKFAPKLSVGMFDKEKYLEMNPDVKSQNQDAWDHYQRAGYKEGREIPVKTSESTFEKGIWSDVGYKLLHPDIERTLPTYSGWQHFREQGYNEKRSICIRSKL